jgi:Tol biopolymer transport system component
MRRLVSVAVVVVLSWVMLAAGGGGAGATTPGTNGQVAFSRYDPELGDSVTYVANPDGTGQWELLPGYTSGSPYWSPDGRYVAVVSGLDNECPPTCTGNTVVIDAATRSVDRVLPSVGFPAVSTFCSIWSPDGTRFLCDGENDEDQSVNGVYSIRSSDGQDLVRITAPADGDDLPIDYSPDGGRIVYGHTGPFHTCDGTSALYVVNVDGTDNHRITPWGFCDDDGSWSPDGSRIAFVTSGSANAGGRSGGSNGAVFTVRPDGSGLTRIALPDPSGGRGRTYAGDVRWSPDGSRIIFLLGVRTDSGFHEGIATAAVDGTDVRWVTTSPTFDHQPDWGTHPVS